MNRFERRHPDASNEWPVFILSKREPVSLRPLDLPQRIEGSSPARNVKVIVWAA